MQINRWHKQMRKGTLEFLVLLCLKEQEYYGYSLITRLKQLADIEVADGTIYPLLSRLEKDLCIESRWEIMASGPARKYYNITQPGLEMVSQMHDAWQGLNQSVADAWE